MDVSTLKSYIKLKTIPTFLIFAGPEWKVQEIYINQIAKVTGKKIVRIDSISEVYAKLRNNSFVQDNIIYIVRDDKELMQNEKLQEKIDNGVLRDNMLIHLLTNVDKRTKFYKKYKDKIIEFDPLSDQMLKKYIKKEINLSDKNCERLINICEHDYGRCLLEIDKIKRYVSTDMPLFGHGKDSTEEDCCFEMLVKNGSIYIPPQDSIFNFVDEVLNRNCNNLFELLQECYEVGEATMVMLSVLYNNAKAVLQLQNCNSGKISQSTGLSGWQIKNAKPHVGKYSTQELVNMLKLIQKCEAGIKTGRIEEQFVMDYLLVKVL